MQVFYLDHLLAPMSPCRLLSQLGEGSLSKGCSRKQAMHFSVEYKTFIIVAELLQFLPQLDHDLSFIKKKL